MTYDYVEMGKPFPCVIQKYTKFANFTGLYFSHFNIYFATKLHDFTKFRTLFPAVLMNIDFKSLSNRGKWSHKTVLF